MHIHAKYTPNLNLPPVIMMCEWWMNRNFSKENATWRVKELNFDWKCTSESNLPWLACPSKWQKRNCRINSGTCTSQISLPPVIMMCEWWMNHNFSKENTASSTIGSINKLRSKRAYRLAWRCLDCSSVTVLAKKMWCHS